MVVAVDVAVDVAEVVSVPVVAMTDVPEVMVAELSVTAVVLDAAAVFDAVEPVADEFSWNSAISKT